MALFPLTQRQITVEVIPTIPAIVSAEGGLSATKENGVITIKPDLSQLPLISGEILPTQEVWTRDPLTDSYARATIQSMASSVTPIGDGDKGDITVDGDDWTVNAGAIDYAKLQDVSASARLLGRKTSGSGNVEELTLSETLDLIGSAAQGDILYRGASGWARLAAGTAGYNLQTNGAGANPTWVARAVWQFDTVAAVAAATIPSWVNYVRTASHTSAVRGSGALYKREESEPSHAAKIQSNDGAWWSVVFEDGKLNVKKFGAKADGSTNDSTAIQNALNYAASIGGAVYCPTGNYKVSAALTFTVSDNSEYSIRKLTFIGDGPGCTVFTKTDDSTFLSFVGDFSGPADATFADFKVYGTGTSGQNGLLLQNFGHLIVSNVHLMQLSRCIWVIDGLSSTFINVTHRWSIYGVVAARSSHTYPNSLSFYQCVFGHIGQGGITNLGGNVFRMYGGSVENCGFNAGTDRWGIYSSHEGYEGSVGLVIDGVYFEGNGTTADINIVHAGATPAIHNISNSTFNRLPGLYGTNCISLTCASGAKAIVRSMGNGFKGWGGYTPNAGRPYIGTSGAAGTDWRVYSLDYMDSATETPSASGQFIYVT